MRSIVRAFAGDSTITSVLAILSVTLARLFDAHEAAAAHARHRTGHFELEQPHEQRRRAEARRDSDRVEIARFTGREAIENRVARTHHRALFRRALACETTCGLVSH